MFVVVPHPVRRGEGARFFCAKGINSAGRIERFKFEGLTQLATIPSLQDPLYVYACIEDKRGGFILAFPPIEIEQKVMSQAQSMRY